MLAPSVIILQPISPDIQEILEKSSKAMEARVEFCADPQALTKSASQEGVHLIVIEVRDAKSVSQALSILKSVSAGVTSRRNRVIVFAGKGSDQEALERLSMQGCSEVISSLSSVKALQLKADRHLRVCAQEVKRILRDIESKKHAQEVKEAKAAARALREAKAARHAKETLDARQARDEEGVETQAEEASSKPIKSPSSKRRSVNRIRRQVLKDVPALSLQSDFWLFFETGDAGEEAGSAKHSAGRWSLRVKGPSPKLGKWTRGEEKDGIVSWIWEMNDPSHLGMPGQWVFRGFRPEYHMELWSFVGSQPSLRFIHEGQSLGARFEVDQAGDLLMAADSQIAREKYRALRRLAQHIEVVEPVSEAETPVVDRHRIEWLPPLEIQSDCWQLHEPPVFRGEWILKMSGPTPHHGFWEQVGTELRWKWSPLEPNDEFIVEEGEWFFKGGEDPSFHEGYWIFRGREVELYFEYNGENYGIRFAGNPDLIQVTEDRERVVSQAVVSSRDSEEEELDPTRVRVDDPMDIEQIETEGVTWEQAGTDADGHPLFVCIPKGVSTGETTSLKQVLGVWIKRGQAAPTLEQKNNRNFWHFEGERPRRYNNLFEVPKKVRDYLASKFKSDEQGAEPSDESTSQDEVIGSSNNAQAADDLMKVTSQPVRVGLSTIALAFIVSELVGQPGSSRDEVMERFLRYIEQSTGGHKVELWSVDVKRVSPEALDSIESEKFRESLDEAYQASLPLKVSVDGRALWICQVRPASDVATTLGYVAIVGEENTPWNEDLLRIIGRTAVSLVVAA